MAALILLGLMLSAIAAGIGGTWVDDGDGTCGALYKPNLSRVGCTGKLMPAGLAAGVLVAGALLAWDAARRPTRRPSRGATIAVAVSLVTVFAIFVVRNETDRRGASVQDPGAPPATSAPPRASTYFVVGSSGWSTKEAYKPRPDDPVTSRAEPTLDWYAEHERFPDPSRSQAVRLSGHDVPMAQLEGTLAGFTLRSRQVHGLHARAGAGPDGPRVVLLPVGPGYTVMTLSYELSIDDLVEWTDALKAVDQAGWVAAGGVIAL